MQPFVIQEQPVHYSVFLQESKATVDVKQYLRPPDADGAKNTLFRSHPLSLYSEASSQ